MSSSRATILDTVRSFARERCAGHDPAHDILHVTRVVANAREIGDCENANLFIVESAAWLHDIVQLPKGTGPAGESARQSATAARAFLLANNVDDNEVAAITHAIESHSFSGGIKPESLEAAVVQDADRLDALGAIGLARLWVVAGTMGSVLYDESDPAGTSREYDDRAFGLDHIPRKLFRLPELMNTESGRALAVSRARFVSDFYEQFLSEIRIR